MERYRDYLSRPTFILIVILLIAVWIAKIFRLETTDYLITIMFFIGIAMSLNIIMGFAGYVSFGHTVFLGISGYVFALIVYYNIWLAEMLDMFYGLPIFMIAILAGAVSAVIAILVGIPVLKLRGAFFAIATIGLDFAALYIIKAVIPIINPEFFGAQIILPAYALAYKDNVFVAMYLTFALVLLTNYFVRRSRFGMGLLAISEDEDAAEALGVPTTKYKILAFALSAFMTGMLGAIFGLNAGGVDENLFNLAHTIDMIVMIVIGGIGTVMGPLIGSIIYFIIYDTLLVTYPEFNLVILGSIVAVLVLFAPRGIIGIVRGMTIGGRRLRDIIE